MRVLGTQYFDYRNGQRRLWVRPYYQFRGRDLYPKWVLRVRDRGHFLRLAIMCLSRRCQKKGECGVLVCVLNVFMNGLVVSKSLQDQCMALLRRYAMCLSRLR